MTNGFSRRAFGAGAVAAGIIGKSAASFAQGTPKRGGTLVATWELPSESTYFRLHVRAKRGALPLTNEVFRKVACPRVISSPNP